MAKEKISRVRGTVDKIASSYQLERKILSKIENYLEIANFSKIEVPILEHLELFCQSIGESTDVVNKELFVIQPRNDQDDRLCLRPEFTAGVFRCFLENKNQVTTPWRVFASGPCFRYERPQKGRLRQFDQVSIEAIGATSIFSDFELLLLLDRIFSSGLGLAEYSLKINCIGTKDERKAFRNKLVTFLNSSQESLCQDCLRRKEQNPLRCFDCKVASCIELMKQAPIILDSLEEKSLSDFKILQDMLTKFSVSFLVDPSLVRGLDYYEGVVFEFVSNKLGAQSTFCGGGRYELANKLGDDEALLCVGAGIGLSRLCMILEETFSQPSRETLAIVSLDDKYLLQSFALLDYLRQNNKYSEIVLEGSSLKSKMKYANKINAKFVVFVGENEIAGNYFSVKNMITGETVMLKHEDILKL